MHDYKGLLKSNIIRKIRKRRDNSKSNRASIVLDKGSGSFRDPHFRENSNHGDGSFDNVPHSLPPASLPRINSKPQSMNDSFSKLSESNSSPNLMLYRPSENDRKISSHLNLNKNHQPMNKSVASRSNHSSRINQIANQSISSMDSTNTPPGPSALPFTNAIVHDQGISTPSMYINQSKKEMENIWEKTFKSAFQTAGVVEEIILSANSMMSDTGRRSSRIVVETQVSLHKRFYEKYFRSGSPFCVCISDEVKFGIKEKVYNHAWEINMFEQAGKEIIRQLVTIIIMVK